MAEGKVAAESAKGDSTEALRRSRRFNGRRPVVEDLDSRVAGALLDRWVVAVVAVAVGVRNVL
jgi:hypothetical protein